MHLIVVYQGSAFRKNKDIASVDHDKALYAKSCFSIANTAPQWLWITAKTHWFHAARVQTLVLRWSCKCHFSMCNIT